MAREIPEAVRAAAGLTATVLDEVRRLPETLPGLPVRVLGMAMQLSMKVQQHYADLVARGDELFTGIRGEDEPGLATFDDDEDDAGSAVAAAARVGTSAFDRVAETVIEVTEDDEPAADEVLDEVAIEDLVDEAPAPGDAVEGETADVATDVDDLADESLSGDESLAAEENLVDVPTADGGVETVEATVTDEGVATPEPTPEPTPEQTPEPTPQATAEATPEPAGETATATDEGGTPVATATDGPQGGSEDSGSQAPGTAPIEGYDDWSIAQLRGRLRGYQTVTVQELLDYEEATRSREPYLRMLRNRLSKLDEQAIESSPLAPRGA